jgi:hypothetical protein
MNTPVSLLIFSITFFTVQAAWCKINTHQSYNASYIIFPFLFMMGFILCEIAKIFYGHQILFISIPAYYLGVVLIFFSSTIQNSIAEDTHHTLRTNIRMETTMSFDFHLRVSNTPLHVRRGVFYSTKIASRLQ